jgi:MarR family transcriptional regulator, organic hydroperoxide resistance regulator
MEKKSIGRIVGILNRHFQTYINLRLKNIDIGFSEYIFLINLYDNEGINQEELSSMLFIDKAATARAIKLLEEKGFLTRKTYEKDKRVKKLYLTDKGREYKEYIYLCLEKWVDFTTKGMDKETIDIVMNGLEFMGKRVANTDLHELL